MAALESQMGLHFDPDGSEEAGYFVTASYWDEARKVYFYPECTREEQFLIEAAFHFLKEAEHNCPDSPDARIELNIYAECLAFLVKDTDVTLEHNRHSFCPLER